MNPSEDHLENERFDNKCYSCKNKVDSFMKIFID